MDMFDDDDTLMYEPAQTAAVILTGDDEEAEKAALEVGWQLAVLLIAVSGPMSHMSLYAHMWLACFISVGGALS